MKKAVKSKDWRIVKKKEHVILELLSIHPKDGTKPIIDIRGAPPPPTHPPALI